MSLDCSRNSIPQHEADTKSGKGANDRGKVLSGMVEARTDQTNNELRMRYLVFTGKKPQNDIPTISYVVSQEFLG